MIAILADVHANRPALTAVLDEARRRGAHRLVLLGDIVGYYAEPGACIELLAPWPRDAVIGNHDLGALGQGDRHANRLAVTIQEWTATRLGAAERAFLTAPPRRLALSWAYLTHGTFTHPDAVVGYVTPVTAEVNLARVAAAGHRLGLFGHSHVPALYVTAQADRVAMPPGTFALPPTAAAIFNPGSVGQPRDGDPRASFALFDPEERTMEIVRVPYDIDATVRAARQAGFDETLAARLREAR